MNTQLFKDDFEKHRVEVLRQLAEGIEEPNLLRRARRENLLLRQELEFLKSRLRRIQFDDEEG